MNLVFDDSAITDLKYWAEIDRKKALKIIALVEEVAKTPFTGSGKPEPLRYHLKGSWSRRIDQEHRLVYHVKDNEIRIVSCRFHYQK